jgi:hypothetical protein
MCDCPPAGAVSCEETMSIGPWTASVWQLAYLIGDASRVLG